MRAVVQRIKEARVTVENRTVASTAAGLLALVAFERGDEEERAVKLVETLLKLRIFPDERGKLSRALTEVEGDLLLISNFTLAGELKHGNRPDFSQALPRQTAELLYHKLLAYARNVYPRVQSGEFGSYMEIHAIQDGPVTLIWEER